MDPVQDNEILQDTPSTSSQQPSQMEISSEPERERDSDSELPCAPTQPRNRGNSRLSTRATISKNKRTCTANICLNKNRYITVKTYNNYLKVYKSMHSKTSLDEVVYDSAVEWQSISKDEKKKFNCLACLRRKRSRPEKKN